MDESNISTTGTAALNGIRVHNLHGSRITELQHDEHILHRDRPSRTVLGQSARHYSGRPTTVRENACLQSFPFDHIFTGGLNHQYKQVGNAVPVMMATQVARSVARVYGLP